MVAGSFILLSSCHLDKFEISLLLWIRLSYVWHWSNQNKYVINFNNNSLPCNNNNNKKRGNNFLTSDSISAIFWRIVAILTESFYKCFHTINYWVEKIENDTESGIYKLNTLFFFNWKLCVERFLVNHLPLKYLHLNVSSRWVLHLNRDLKKKRQKNK